MFYYSAPQWTGGARAFAAAARELAVRGYQVTYVCPAGPVEARAAADGCDVIPLERADSLLVQAWRLQRVLTERFVETVFVHTESEQLAVSMAMRMAGRGGVVRRVPAGATVDAGRATRIALVLATGGFVFTTAAEAHAAPVLPRARQPAVAELGVDVARYDELRGVPPSTLGASGPNARLVVCAYDHGAKSQAATVLRTVALLARRHADLRVAFLGPGSTNEDLRMHAAALGIGRQVSYLGERDDDLAVLRAADLGWVVASDDTAAFAALDLMAMRIPVLADQGTVAARYVADGITGALLTPGDTPATAATVAALLAGEDQRRAMGNAGRARVAREYTETAMVDALQRAADTARDRTRWAV